MCRSIKTLFNFEPPASDEEIAAAALQFVRKLSGYRAPSAANAPAFDRAVSEVAASARTLLDSLQTNARPRDRETEAAKRRRRRHDHGAPAVGAGARRAPGRGRGTLRPRLWS